MALHETRQHTHMHAVHKSAHVERYCSQNARQEPVSISDHPKQMGGLFGTKKAVFHGEES